MPVYSIAQNPVGGREQPSLQGLGQGFLLSLPALASCPHPGMGLTAFPPVAGFLLRSG